MVLILLPPVQTNLSHGPHFQKNMCPKLCSQVQGLTAPQAGYRALSALTVSKLLRSISRDMEEVHPSAKLAFVFGTAQPQIDLWSGDQHKGSQSK